MRAMITAPGAPRVGLPCPVQGVRHTPLAPATRRHLRPQGRRSRSGITPMAMFSRYDPFGIPPPYRSSSGQWGAGSGSNSRMSGDQRLSAASPAQRQAMLSSAISAVTDWPQLWSIVERYGRYLTANNVTHALTKLEQLVQGQQYRPAEASQIEDLLEWLLQRGRELNATAQLGPQALGATAGAVSRLQQAQRQQQQQQQEAAAQQQRQQQQQQQGSAQSEAAAKLQRQQQAAAVERDQLMRELVDAAVSQKHRLSPQALNNLLSALAEIEESDMSADDIRQLLHLPTKTKQAPSTAASQRASPAQSQQQQQQRQWQQQQQQQQQAQPVSSSSTSRSVSPGSLQATARQLGQLSPELAEEWYDRALRQGLEQGYIPAGIDQSYISGFLAREIQRAAARAASSEGSGAVLLSSTVSKYSQLLGVDHLALALHKLADLQQQEAAGSDQEVKAAAGSFFQRLQPLVSEADGATLASLVSSCKDLQLYSKTLLQACLARAEILLEQQLQGFVSQQAGFSGRRLGVLLHSLAVLGLKPSTNWLRLAVTAAGEVLSGCSIIDLERLASALLIMRVDPGRQWVTVAEGQLEHLAAALGSGDSRRLPHAGKEELLDDEEEDEEGTGNARRALVACVKALALLGGQRACGWYQSILAADEQQQRLEQQQQLTEAELRRRQAEYEQQQAALQAAQQQQQRGAGSAAAGEQAVERQLQKAVQQQHRRPKLHLHPHHHLQHHHPASKQQQQQQQPSSGGRSELGPLSSLDDLMSQQLAMQQGGQQQGPLGPDSKLPQSRTSLSGPESNPAAAAAEVEAAAPAEWATEQASRWAQSRGEAGQPSPAAEVQQRLDDSQKLFGSSTSSGRRGKGGSSAAGQQQAGGAPQQKSPQAKVGQDSTAGSSSSSAGSKGGPRPQESSSAAAASAGRPAAPREIPVKFDAGSSSSSGRRSAGDSRPLSRQAQRSAAEAADALAALMAEIDSQAVPESDQEEVLKELGLTDGPDSLAESKVQAAELQEAADRVKQATQQLDELQKQKQQRSTPATADVGPGHEQHTGGASKRQKHDKKQQHKQSARAADSKKAAPKRPLGSSGEPAFVAAAEALQGPQKPSRNFLLGCLEAIEQQQEQLKIKLAEKQALSAVAGAAARQRKAAAAAQDPAARQLQQLTADFDRARERAEAEKSGIRAAAAADVLSRLLPLLDSFEAAEAALDQQQRQQGSAGNEREYEDARRVYNALHAQLLSIIKSQGARVLGQDGDLEGKPFDPAEMEAVMRQPAPAGFGDGEVLKVLRKGYAIGDKLVRPALVVVAYED